MKKGAARCMKSATDLNTFTCDSTERLFLDPDPKQECLFCGLTSQKSLGIRIRISNIDLLTSAVDPD
jgi:hypothetical protein